MTLRARSLLSLPVLVDDITVGHVVDLILDRSLERVLGFEVRCGDEEHRFLAFAAAAPADKAVQARTPLAVLDSHQLSFYARGGTSLRALRGSAVRVQDGEVGVLADLELGPDGTVARVVTGQDGSQGWERAAVTVAAPARTRLRSV